MHDIEVVSQYQIESKILFIRFQLTKDELNNWKSQIVISNSIKMGIRKLPYVFTQDGVAMLSSVLNSEKAINVNIQIMRTFTKIREMFATHKKLRQKIEGMEKKYDYRFEVVFDTIRKLLEPQGKPVKKVGFIKGKRAKYQLGRK
ncbi:MAG: ORF6N domain-containing protein [bacterium]